MSVSLVIFIIIHLTVFAFFVESLRRATYRAKEYPMNETSDTLPLGFIKLKHVITLYIFVYIVWIIFSIWLYSVFIGDFNLQNTVIRSKSNIILDL